MFKSIAFLALSLIELQPGDRNGTGYFDGLVTRTFNSMCRAIDEHGRNILIIPTDIGNLVVFERFSNGTHDVWVFNTPSGVRQIFFTAASGFEKNIIEDRLNGNLSIAEELLHDYIKQFHIMNEEHRADILTQLTSTLQKLGWTITAKE